MSAGAACGPRRFVVAADNDPVLRSGVQRDMRVTVKLGSILRSKAPGFVGGEGTVELPDTGAITVSDVMRSLDIASDEVNVIYRNHVFVAPSAPVHDGDRVALFPPLFIHFSQFYLQRHDD